MEGSRQRVALSLVFCDGTFSWEGTLLSPLTHHTLPFVDQRALYSRFLGDDLVGSELGLNG